MWASLVAQTVNNLSAMQEAGFNPWVGKILWKREWQPIFFPGEFHGQRILAGYSPWGCKELDTMERLTLSLFRYICNIIYQCYVTESDQIRSVAQLCPTLCDPMNRSTPGFPVHHQLLELTETHVHRVSDAIQPSHPLSSPSPLAPNPSPHQSLFQWVNSSHEVAKVLKL